MKVRDVIRVLENDGWRLKATRGSHRGFVHPAKPGKVTVAGKPGDDLKTGTLGSILRQAGLETRRCRVRKWAVVFEKAEYNYSAYVPDLPGCVATGATIEETKRNLGEAIDLHLEMMRADGDKIPEPTTLVDFVEHDVPAAAKRS